MIRHRHDWYIVHHTDEHGHHWCPTGFMMCSCAKFRKTRPADPECSIPAPYVIKVYSDSQNDTASSSDMCIQGY